MTRRSSDATQATSAENSPTFIDATEAEQTTTPGSLDVSTDSGEGDFLRQLARAPIQTPSALAELAPGQLVGGYRIVEKLGAGGMGVVYAADDVKLGRRVALKILPNALDVERRRRFLREARSASAVSHPNIATVYAVGEDAGTVFIAMERAPGRTLRARLEQESTKRLPITEALRITRDIAAALVKAHAAGIVHRDLKPENIMVSDEGATKILDFGLAKLREPDAGEHDPEVSELATREGRILGTPSYMSPEQAKGRPVDARSDLFALGVVLYEMLSGTRPFSGSTTVEIAIAIDRDDYPPVSEHCSEADSAVGSVLARCLAKLPENRYPNASALIDAIDDLPRARTRRRRRVALVASIGVLTVAGAVWAVSRASQSHTPAPVASGSSLSPGTLRELPAASVAPPPASVASPAVSDTAASTRQRPRSVARPAPDPLSDQK